MQMHIYMEFRKMIMTILYARQQKRQRCKERLGFFRRRQGWDDLRGWDDLTYMQKCILPYIK